MMYSSSSVMTMSTGPDGRPQVASLLKFTIFELTLPWASVDAGVSGFNHHPPCPGRFAGSAPQCQRHKKWCPKDGCWQAFGRAGSCHWEGAELPHRRCRGKRGLYQLRWRLIMNGIALISIISTFFPLTCRGRTTIRSGMEQEGSCHWWTLWSTKDWNASARSRIFCTSSIGHNIRPGKRPSEVSSRWVTVFFF